MKFVKILLCFAILLGSVNCVYAAEDNGVTEALRQVKERVDTDKYANFKSSYYKNEDGKIDYYFTWSNDGEEYENLYINYADGIITNYGKYSYNDDEYDAFSLDIDEAAEIAKEFVKKINPNIYDDIVFVPDSEQSIHYSSYTINIYMVHDGIPVLNETGYVSVSKSTREACDFYITYNADISYKPLTNIISEDDAKKAYAELIQPTLRYNFKRDYEKQEISAYLEYESDYGYAINAYDGSRYKTAYFWDTSAYSKNEAAAGDAEDEGRGFSPAEIEETERIAGLLSETEAENIIRNNKIIAMPKSYKAEYISLRRKFFSKNEYIYSFNFENDEYGYASATIDAKSGEILSFYRYSDRDETKKIKQDRKNEEKLAKAALEEFAGEKAAEFTINEDENTGWVSFDRMYDGIEVSSDGAYIDFDYDDKISGYNINYTNEVTFPSKNGVISAKEASEKAFSKLGFGLAYAIDYDEKTAQPVYYMGKDGELESYTMNPFTAALTDYNGEDKKSPKSFDYSDIDTHYGKKIFLELARYGIGFAGGELKPDEPITQAEYFGILNAAFGYEAEKDEIYERMISWGTLSADERADDSILTREKAAIFMIREMGAERYAKFEDIFAPPFNDVTENKGYIAILKAEKVINGDGSGNFYPQKSVTRGEALIMIYNYFKK